MTRRTAFQSLIAVICGAMDPEQKTTPTTPKSQTWTTSVLDLNAPRSLRVYLQWKDITVHRGNESLTIDQDELFRALKGDAK